MFSLPFVPEQASDFAKQYDDLFYVMLALSVFFTLLVLSLLLFFVIRYRRGHNVNRKMGKGQPLGLEIGWTVTPLLLGLVFFFWSAGPFAKVMGKAPANATEIYVIGKQWMWHLQHTNGVRENNELHIPVGQPIKLTMISQDVIHSFFVPAFRIKKDVVPGRYQSIWFTPTKVGKYHLFCAQYCGTEHSQMTGWVYVMEPRDYQTWLASGGQSTAAPRGSMVATGEQLFNQLACVQCHGFAPARAPSLIGLYNSQVTLTDGRSITADEAYIRESIVDPNAKVVNGYQPIMPNFKSQLSEEQLLDLVAFIKTMGVQPTPTAPTGATAPTTGAGPVSAPNTGAATNEATPAGGGGAGASGNAGPSGTTTGTTR